MVFTKRIWSMIFRLNKFFTIVLLSCVLFISACTSVSQRDMADEAVVEAPAPEADPNAPLVKVPNPYLAQRVAVSEPVKVAFKQGLSLIAAKKWPEAQSVFDKLTREAPTLSGPWVNLGIALAKQNKTEEAHKAWLKAIEVNQYNNDAYNLLALSKRELGLFKEAESHYKQALAAWPHSVESNLNLGILYDLYMGKFELALKHYELADKLLDGSQKKLKGWIIDLKRRMSANAKKS